MVKKTTLVLVALLLLAGLVTPASADSNYAPSKVGIQNKTGESFRIVFTGAHTYYVTLHTGKNSVSMEPGAYNYSYTACGTTITGKLKVKAGSTNLVLPKCPKENETCDPSYPTVCIPKRPPDLDCWQISFRGFKVKGKDPHNFDGDHDGIGCELY